MCSIDELHMLFRTASVSGSAMGAAVAAVAGSCVGGRPAIFQNHTRPGYFLPFPTQTIQHAPTSSETVVAVNSCDRLQSNGQESRKRTDQTITDASQLDHEDHKAWERLTTSTPGEIAVHRSPPTTPLTY